MNQERGNSRWSDDDALSCLEDAELYQVLADVPMPAPAVVIDVRPQTTNSYPLLWNLATEIEELAAQMRLKHVPHWEYLEECIGFLHVSTEETPSKAKHITLISSHDKQTFTSDAEFATNVNISYINRVRNNRQSSAVRQEWGENRHYRHNVSPVQSMVRVFFIIDMELEDTFAQAINYTSVLKQENYNYDDPERTGHDKRLSVYAVCMNAELKQREELFRRFPTFKTIFDTVILIQAYRDDGMFIGHDIQVYEVEQILYALLLVSPGEITDEHDVVNDEDLSHYLAFVDQPTAVPYCSFYIIGLSSTEFSARWGRRWLSYGLVAKLIELVEDKQEVEYGEALLQVPDDQQGFDSWWESVQSILPNALPILLPQTKSVITRPTFMASVRVPSSLAMTMRHVEALRQQADEWYGDAAGFEGGFRRYHISSSNDQKQST